MNSREDGPPPGADLINAARSCTLCAGNLPHAPRPVFQLRPTARILIAGQAPGRKVHETGLPFNDASGDRLRDWLGVSRAEFYDPDRVAIVPMGFCYPGTGKSGDLPPRPDCAPAWRAALLALLTELRITLVIGKYAQDYHFERRLPVTERVRLWRRHWPQRIPLPHPSPRNNLWLRRNPWFEAELVPALQQRVREILGSEPSARVGNAGA